MGNFIGSLIAILSLPLLILNFFAGIVGFVWLGWLGDWTTLLYAFISAVTAPLALSFPLMLALIFAFPAMFFYGKGSIGRVLSIPFMLLSGLVSWIVMAAWGLTVFFQVMKVAQGADVLPYLLVAYSVTTSSWSYMASKEGPEASVGVPLFFTQLSAAWFVLSIWLSLAAPQEIILVYLGIMGVGPQGTGGGPRIADLG